MLHITTNSDGTLDTLLKINAINNAVSSLTNPLLKTTVTVSNIQPNDVSVSYPLIYSKNDFKKPMLINTDNGIYVIKGNYPMLNTDKKFKSKVIKYFRNEIADNWLYDDLSKLLNYLKVNDDGKVVFISSISELNNQNADSIQNMEKKIRYIEDEVLDKHLIEHVLSKFVKKNGINWYDLKQHRMKVKNVFRDYLDMKFEDYVKTGRF